LAQPLDGEKLLRVGGEHVITVAEAEAVLTHLPLSVCVAVKTSAELREETVIVHVVPLQVADPEEMGEPLLNTLMDEPFIPVPETVVAEEHIVPVMAGAVETD
jgi:hypothetical protein